MIAPDGSLIIASAGVPKSDSHITQTGFIAAWARIPNVDAPYPLGTPSGGGGLFYGGNANLLWHQFAGVLFTIVWCGVLTAVIGLAIKYTIGWRVTSDEEVEGIDLNDLGETAYDWGGASGSHIGVSASAPAAPTIEKDGALA